jgi:osmoprotectant transport system permease protein
MNFDYLIDHWQRVLELARDHLELSLGAVAIALVMAIPIGVLAARYRRLTLPVLSVLGAIYTVPTLALLAFLIPSLGIGRRPALIVLALYAQIFLVRNIVAGLRGVNPGTLEAARGIGMTPWQVFRQVHWPLALPVMLAGLRTAVVTTISLATVAAWVDAGGLGTLLFQGLARLYPSETLAGAIAIVALALLSDAVLRLAERGTAISRARRAVG